MAGGEMEGQRGKERDRQREKLTDGEVRRQGRRDRGRNQWDGRREPICEAKKKEYFKDQVLQQ